MNRTEEIRGAIINRLVAVPGIGQVYRYQRYAAQQSEFRRLYQVGDQVLDWYVRRMATAERVDTIAWNEEHRQWRIEGVMSLNDAAASEITFDALIDEIRSTFRGNETLDDVVETTVVNNQAGVQLETSGPVMFAGVLCHRAQMSLTTITRVEAARGLTQAAMDDDFDV